jgi:putative FmdB family regulatory protein
MPLYEYRCQDCSRRFTALVGVVADSRDPSCPRCGSANLKRLMSRFGSPRSEDQILDDLADIDRYGDIEENPRKLKKWVREMSKSLDEDLGDDLEEMLEEMDRPETEEDGVESDADRIY